MPDEVGQFVIGVDTRDTAGRPSGKFVPLYDEAYRRSIYVQVRRSMPLGMLEAFDAPTMTTQCNCELRSLSTVAPQSLIMMNSEFLVDHATYMAWELSTTGTTSDAQVSLAWLRAFARSPDADELKGARSFLANQQAALRTTASATDKIDPSLRALATLCQALLGSNEFLYVD
jgi:hypothetical protein